MSQEDAVPIVIQNRRVRRPVVWLWILIWGVTWIAVGVMVVQRTPVPWPIAVQLSLFVAQMLTFVALLFWLIRQRPRIKRVKLTEEMQVFGARRLKPAEIAAIRLTPDPDEDFVDSKLPIPLCQIEIVPRRGPVMRLIGSTADARRLREWAFRKAVVFDESHILLAGDQIGGMSDG